MSSINALVNNLYDGGFRTALNIGKQSVKYLGTAYLLLKLTGCTIPDEKPPEIIPIYSPIPNPTDITPLPEQTNTPTLVPTATPLPTATLPLQSQDSLPRT